MSQSADTPAPTADPAPRSNPKRKAALLGIAAVVVIAAIGYGFYWSAFLRNVESTDNAYVQGDMVQITPQVGGTVLAINVDDTDFVKAGQTLVRLDPADAKVALEQAEAQLAQAVREVRTVFANNQTYGAQIAARQADMAKAQADVAKAQEDVDRRAPLVQTGAVGQEEFEHSTVALQAARSTLAAARSAVLAAREQLQSNQSLTEGTSVAEHPNVQRAAAHMREAFLALRRVELPAPVDGYVARRGVQLGQRVAAGSTLMSIVPLSQVWVDANFKEVQLRRMRIGQPVTLHADVYGSGVEYRGTVVGLSAGTGSAFSLLPAQNATGNWIKVVQRVPVRVALGPQQLAAHPLRIGLSMLADVNVQDQNGRILSNASRPSSAFSTPVFDRLDGDADARVQRVITGNLGAGARSNAAHARAGAAVAAARGAAAARQ